MAPLSSNANLVASVDYKISAEAHFCCYGDVFQSKFLWRRVSIKTFVKCCFFFKKKGYPWLNDVQLFRMGSAKVQLAKFWTIADGVATVLHNAMRKIVRR